MNPLHLCEKCKKPILKSNEEIKDNNYYHKKCINSIISNDNKENDEEKKKFAQEKNLTSKLKDKYTNNYLGKSIMTEVVRPYLQFKYTIKKNKYLELIPQVSLYFNDIDENKAKEFIKNGGIEKMKNELQEILGEDVEIIFYNIIYGSLLTKMYFFVKKAKSVVESVGGAMISCGKKLIKKVRDFLTFKNEETKIVKEAIDVIQSHSFKCIANLKPSDVKFINQKNLENKESKEKEINKFLEEKIESNFDAKKSWLYESNLTESTSTETNFEEKEITEEDFNNLYDEIKDMAEKNEMELKEEIENVKSNEYFNNSLYITLEKVFKESIFEFRITGLVINNKDKEKMDYEERKKKCPNCETKILFHATKISFSSKILTTNFKLSNDCYFGKGVYFSDQLDYVKFYYKNSSSTTTESSSNELQKKGPLQAITKLNGSFSIVVSEVYYDKTKFKQIYDYSHSFDEIIQNGIHYAEVDSRSFFVINENKKILVKFNLKEEDFPKERYIGREYCVTDIDQILPLYGINLQRVDYCIIWRDSNFNSYIWKESLNKNKEIIKNMTGYNLYTENNSKDALRLVWRKRFNKIIIITNVGNNLEGKKYVDKVRQILQFNVVALFFTNDYRHLDWIKDYPNGLFCMDDYTIKKYIFHFDEDGYNDIKNTVKEFFGVELKKPENAFDYPLFEKYKDDIDKDGNPVFLGDLSLGEYNDFDGI